MRNLRVLHFNDAAGQGWNLSRAQRKLGLKADLVVHNENKYGYGSDFNLKYDRTLIGKFKLNITSPFWLSREIFQYDIFHFYRGFVRFYSPKFSFGDWDIKLLKKLNKKFVFHFLGSDVRQTGVFKKYKYSYSDELGLDEKWDEQIGKRLNWLRGFADLLIVGDYELEEYVPGSVVVPTLYDEAILKTRSSFSVGNKIKIVHAPSNRIIKGTDFIIPVVERIKSELRSNYDIEFVMVENVSHDKAIDIYGRADICVDQLRIGSYGTFAIECMALGKPVMSYIREDLVGKYPNLPIMNSNPDNLYLKMKELILNKELRRELGKQSVGYVKKRHAPFVVARQVVNLYEGLYKNDKKVV